MLSPNHVGSSIKIFIMVLLYDIYIIISQIAKIDFKNKTSINKLNLTSNLNTINLRHFLNKYKSNAKLKLSTLFQ